MTALHVHSDIKYVPEFTRTTATARTLLRLRTQTAESANLIFDDRSAHKEPVRRLTNNPQQGSRE
jgi:hypothetical protein